MKLLKYISRQNFVSSAVMAASSALLLTSQAFAFMDAGLEYGVRNNKWEQDSTSKGISAQTIRASLHLDPIPLVPVGFGLGLYSETWKVSEADHGLKNLSSFSVVPEVTAWIPLGDLKPFARVGYSVLSGYTGKGAIAVGTETVDGSVGYAGAGLHIGAGIEYSVPVVPLLSVIGTVEYSSERLKLAQDKIGDTEVPGSRKNVTTSGTALLAGVKLGF